MSNIFENIMDSNEFMDKIADKIAADWNACEKNPDIDNYNLYRWIQGGFADSLTEAVRKKVEG